MQANWSLVLNILLLIGVFVAIVRMLKIRRRNVGMVNYHPSLGVSETSHDDIIAVRKIHSDLESQESAQQTSINAQTSTVRSDFARKDMYENAQRRSSKLQDEGNSESIMIFLLAKERRQLAGYELLQTLLTAGLRFGEGNLFHRHQSPNGQGPVLCSLAAATETGVFDLQNIGAFSVHGLCLFMQASGNPTIDADRFAIMLDTAKQLSEGLDTYILDDKRKPLSQQSINNYCTKLNFSENGRFQI